MLVRFLGRSGGEEVVENLVDCLLEGLVTTM